MNTAIISRQKTAYWVTDARGRLYTDQTGHSWFTLAVARDHARRLGGWYERGSRTSIKEVVQGYENSLDTLRAGLAAAGVTADSPALDAAAEQLAREERWT